MKFDDLKELEALAAEQMRVRTMMTKIDARIEALRRRLEAAPMAEKEDDEVHAVVMPPPLPVRSAPPVVESPVAETPVPAASVAVPAVDLPKPETLQDDVIAASAPVADPEPAPPQTVENFSTSNATPAANEPAPASPPARRESLELQLGTVWLARAGIVILITGLVFLGNYAWQHIVHRLGAGGKLALITLAGIGLAALGAKLERTRQELRNYGRVLMAGGAATIYYAVYAAHFVPSLQIIRDPIVGGALLLACAGAFAWWAHRRRSQTFAVLAILLAYYTSVINEVGAFTLFSGLLLTATAVFFLVKHRWASVSWVALIGTYGSYAFWRWHQAEDPAQFGLRFAESWHMTVSFLTGYWLLFTAAGFLASAEALPPVRRMPFLTLNNAAYFAFGSLLIYSAEPDLLWRFSLVFGAALLGLADFARRRCPGDRWMDGSYLAQGLLLVTASLAAKLTGPQTAILLAAESALLLGGILRRHGRIFQVGATLSAICAFLKTLTLLYPWRALGLLDTSLETAAAVAVFLIFDTWWIKQRRGTLAAKCFDLSAAIFSLPALWLVTEILLHQAPDDWKPTVLAIAALVCTASIYLLQLPEIALPGQLFLAGAVCFWALNEILASSPRPWWLPLPVVASALALAHWWQHQRILPLKGTNRIVLQSIFAAVVISVGANWIRLYVHGDAWLLVTTGAALGTLLYGLLTRCWPLAILGQIFTLLGCYTLLADLPYDQPDGKYALVPIAGLAVTSLVIQFAARQKRLPSDTDHDLAGVIANAYRLGASALLGVWVHHYIDEPWRTAAYAAMGAGFLLAAARSGNYIRSWTGAVYGAIALASFWIRWEGTPVWQDLLAICAIPAAARVSRKLSGDKQLPPDPVPAIFAGATVFSLWLWTTLWTPATFGDNSGAGLLTVAWAILALVIFAAGLGLRERIYRIGGFVLLGLSVGRVFLVDVWRLETIYRIISFLVLGIVLLALGFVYNRYAETIRKWI